VIAVGVVVVGAGVLIVLNWTTILVRYQTLKASMFGK